MLHGLKMDERIEAVMKMLSFLLGVNKMDENSKANIKVKFWR